MNLSVLRLLLRPESGKSATLLIPAVAFAIVAALVLTVVGGAQSFWTWDDEYSFIYQLLATIALALLVLPLASLGGSAARLSARRRDERLSTLRLLGVTPFGVGVATVVESTVIAAVGVLAGVVGYLLLVPLVGLIPFRGAPLGAESILLPVWIIAVACLAIVLLSAVSAMIGLRRVVISPLGVRTRAQAASAHWIRAVVTVVVLGAVVVGAQLAPSAAAFLSLGTILAVLFSVTLLLLSVVGPWAVKVFARSQVKRARTASRLLAARLVLDDPKAAWRQVSGVGDGELHGCLRWHRRFADEQRRPWRGDNRRDRLPDHGYADGTHHHAGDVVPHGRRHRRCHPGLRDHRSAQSAPQPALPGRAHAGGRRCAQAGDHVAAAADHGRFCDLRRDSDRAARRNHPGDRSNVHGHHRARRDRRHSPGVGKHPRHPPAAGSRLRRSLRHAAGGLHRAPAACARRDSRQLAAIGGRGQRAAIDATGAASAWSSSCVRTTVANSPSRFVSVIIESTLAGTNCPSRRVRPKVWVASIANSVV